MHDIQKEKESIKSAISDLYDSIEFITESEKDDIDDIVLRVFRLGKAEQQAEIKQLNEMLLNQGEFLAQRNAEIYDLKQQLQAVHDSRIDFVEYHRSVEGIDTNSEVTPSVTPSQKRQQFAKDLDKLVSSDYVLMPKEPSVEMVYAGVGALLTCGEGLVLRIYKAMVQVAQGHQHE